MFLYTLIGMIQQEEEINEKENNSKNKICEARRDENMWICEWLQLEVVVWTTYPV